MAYIGTLGLAHGLVTVVDAAERLSDEPDVVFLLIGDGADRARLEEEIRRRKLSNVRLLGLRPRTEIPAWIASIDVALVMLRNLPVFETVIPSKIFEFLAAGTARWCWPPSGEIRRLVEDAKAGFVVDPEDADALVAAISGIRAQPAGGGGAGARRSRVGGGELPARRAGAPHGRLPRARVLGRRA